MNKNSVMRDLWLRSHQMYGSNTERELNHGLTAENTKERSNMTKCKEKESSLTQTVTNIKEILLMARLKVKV